jgi:hypothetical protein
MKTPSLTTATETATDALGGTVGDIAGDVADSAADLMGEAVDLAGELTSQAADRLVEGAVLAAGSSRLRSKRFGVALVLLALAAAVLVWRRRSADQAGSQQDRDDRSTRTPAA